MSSAAAPRELPSTSMPAAAAWPARRAAADRTACRRSRARRARPRRPREASTCPLNMITGIDPCRSCSRCRSSQPSVPGQHDVEQHELRRLVFDGCERLLGAGGLAHQVALELEVDPHERPQRRVVVDDEDERAADRRPRGRSGRRTPRGRSGGSGDASPACRTPARAPGRTTCGSSTGRRRGTWPPARASASRGPRRTIASPVPPRKSNQSFRFLNAIMGYDR